MIKLVFCLRRKPGTTRQEFQRYWREQHATLVAERAEVLGIRRYVQDHTADLDALHEALQARNGGSPVPYDGVAELWFDSTDAFESGDPARIQAVTDLLEWWIARLVRAGACGDTPGRGSTDETTGDVVPGEGWAELAARLAPERNLDRWAELWEKTSGLIRRAESARLDRKQVLLNAFLALESTARA